LKSRQ